MMVPMITQIVNPGNVEYKHFVINEPNLLFFDTTLGVYATN